MANADTKSKRPLSPHLQIYRWPITMAMSIVHRVTGIALYGGSLLLIIWLLALATSERAFDAVHGFFGSFLGLVILFGFTWTLMHHMLGGIRHLVWDLGHGFERETRERLGWATIIGSASLTILLWVVGIALW